MMVPEKGKKCAIGYVGEFGYDGFGGVAECNGNCFVEMSDGKPEVFWQFEICDAYRQLAYFPEQSIIAEV